MPIRKIDLFDPRRDHYAIDPRNPNHPSHDEEWLAFAKILGRAAADADWDRLHKEGAQK
jgi:hypothetical protein